MKKQFCDFCGALVDEEKPYVKHFGTAGYGYETVGVAGTEFPVENHLKLNRSEIILCRDCAKKTAKWILKNLAIQNPSKREEQCKCP